MLSHAKLPLTLWVEAMFTDVHIINLSPLVPLEGDIPQRVVMGKDVSYKHLRVFGCRVFIHIPRDERSKLAKTTKQFLFHERSKLAKTTKQCIFLGYSEDEFAYRFWDPISKKVIRSQDVVFRVGMLLTLG